MSDGRTLVRFAFRSGDSLARPGPARLPLGALHVSARVDGREVQNPLADSAEGRLRVVLPWPADAGSVGELIYECPAPSWRFMTQAVAMAPEFLHPLAVRWIWRLPIRLTPLAPTTWSSTRVENGITEWTAPPGTAGDQLILIETTSITAVGGVLAALTALVGIAALMRRRRMGASAGLTGAMAAILLLWLPAHLRAMLMMPLLASLFVGIAAMTLALVRRRMPAAAALALIFACVLVVSGAAAPAGPVQVYLVLGPSGDAATATVLAPPDLIDRLRESAQRSVPPVKPVLLGGRYDGRVRGDIVQFNAHFIAENFSDGPAALAVPLTGLMLRSATVDGKPAFPKPGAGPDRYVFELPGKGQHSLAIQFDVPVIGAADREARFGIPELAASRLVLHLPPGAGRPQALSWRGAQAVTADAGGPILEADLGRVAAAHVRWREPGTSDSPSSAPVQEVILWDLTESSARVQAVFRHRLGSSFVGRLEYDLPPEWEPAAASVRAVDDRAATVGVIGVKQWVRSDLPNASRLGLEFQSPLTGQVQVSIEMVPKRPLKR